MVDPPAATLDSQKRLSQTLGQLNVSNIFCVTLEMSQDKPVVAEIHWNPYIFEIVFLQFAEVCFRVTCRCINSWDLFFDFYLKKCISHNYKYIKHFFSKNILFLLKHSKEILFLKITKSYSCNPKLKRILTYTVDHIFHNSRTSKKHTPSSSHGKVFL